MADRSQTTDRNRRCHGCNAPVSRRFVRVFGVDGTVHGCLECLTRTELAVGMGAVGTEELSTDAGARWDHPR